MRLEISVSERDKHTLMCIGIVAVLVLSFRLLIQPALERGQELENAIAEASATRVEQRIRIHELEHLNEDIERLRLALEEASKPYFNPLMTWEIDSLITGLAVRHGLIVESLDLTEAVPGMAAPYIFAPEQELSETPLDEGGEVEIADPDEALATGLLLASAQLEASGKAAQWQAFLDDVVQNYPGLRVARFEISAHSDGAEDSVSVNRIRCDLEIYMCEEATGT